MTEEKEAEYQRRIRDLQKEVARWKSQIKEQRYGLTWIDVPETFDEESENAIPILEEVKDKAIKNNDGKPTHILIEGDNYHALTCLNYTHRGKVDVIYIDPPYNTGNDGFTYKDKRVMKQFPDGSPVPKDHPLRHSYWLSFMSKRLELAKNLLSDKGVIFISIDDNEQANLKLLCDKVFGEGNLLAQIIWERSYAPINLKKHFSENHDFILAYARNISSTQCNGLPRSETANNRYKNLDNDPRGVWKSDNLSVGPRVEEKVYEIVTPSGRVVSPPSGYCWRLDKETFAQYCKDNRIWFGENGNNVPSLKRFLSEVKQGITPMTIWKYSEVGHTQDAAQKLKDIFGGESKFLYPKPVDLIKRVEELYSSKSSLILDFFAGSGTTLHATMQLNEEDGGRRQCILVQQNEGEKRICEEVTYERNRRVMQGYKNAKGEDVEGLGNSLKYYRTTFVGKHQPRHASDADKIELSQKAGYLLALGENTLEETLCTSSYQFFSDEHEHYTAVYFTGDLSDFGAFVEHIVDIQQKAEAHIAVYIFSWGSIDIFDNEFDNLQGISLKAIPQPILEIYQSINN